MKKVKTFENFSEEYRLNENLLKKAWGAIINFFRRKFGKHAWIYYALYLKKNNQLPENQVELICPPSYLSESEVPTTKQIEDELEKTKSEVGDDFHKHFDEVEESLKEGVEALGDNSGYVSMKHIDPNMRNVNVKQLVARIERVYQMNALRAGRHQEEKYSTKSEFARKKNHALFIWGAPGIGKTEILHQVAKKLELAVIEWHLATIEPTDFRGIPKIVGEKTETRLPAIFPTSDGKNGKGGIMFFDELNRAPEMVLAASLSLALSGKHGEYELPPRWIVIAAGNRPDDITGKLQDDPILWNRFHHVNYVPDISEWIDFAKQQPHINPDLITFFEVHPQFYHQLSTDSQAPNWPSPRTWEMASEEDYFERAEDWKNRLPSSELMEIYEDLVGYKAAKKFVEYVQKQEEKRRKEWEAKKGKGGMFGGFGGRKGDMGDMDDMDMDDMDENPNPKPTPNVPKGRIPRKK